MEQRQEIRHLALEGLVDLTTKEMKMLVHAPKTKKSQQTVWKQVLACAAWDRLQPLIYPFIAWTWPEGVTDMESLFNYNTRELPQGLTGVTHVSIEGKV